MYPHQYMVSAFYITHDQSQVFFGVTLVCIQTQLEFAFGGWDAGTSQSLNVKFIHGDQLQRWVSCLPQLVERSEFLEY